MVDMRIRLANRPVRAKVLALSSGEVGDVLRTIASTAEQTNFLALNAATEARAAAEDLARFRSV